MLDLKPKEEREKEQEILNKLMIRNKQELFPENSEKVWVLSIVTKGQPFIVEIFKSLDDAFVLVKKEFNVTLKWIPHEVRPLYFYAKLNNTIFILDCWVVQ